MITQIIEHKRHSNLTCLGAAPRYEIPCVRRSFERFANCSEAVTYPARLMKSELSVNGFLMRITVTTRSSNRDRRISNVGLVLHTNRSKLPQLFLNGTFHRAETSPTTEKNGRRNAVFPGLLLSG